MAKVFSVFAVIQTMQAGVCECVACKIGMQQKPTQLYMYVHKYIHTYIYIAAFSIIKNGVRLKLSSSHRCFFGSFSKMRFAMKFSINSQIQFSCNAQMIYEVNENVSNNNNNSKTTKNQLRALKV